MTRLTKSETRLMLELLDREINDLCARLNPEKEWYVGQSQHDLAEGRLSEAVSIREKLVARLPGERFNPLSWVKKDNQPRFRDKILAEKFREEGGS